VAGSRVYFQPFSLRRLSTLRLRPRPLPAGRPLAEAYSLVRIQLQSSPTVWRANHLAWRNLSDNALDMEELRCRVYGPLPYFYIGMLCLFTFVFAPIVIVSSLRSGFPIWFAALWLGGLAWNWYAGLTRFAYEVRLSTGGVLSFKTVLREVTIDARDLISVGPAWWDLNGIGLVFRTSSGKVRSFRSMTGLSALIVQLRLFNPTLETRGV
jgi:hypothetical protein